MASSKFLITNGDKFGLLVALESNNGRGKIACQCECGGVKTCEVHALASGRQTSCGCRSRKPLNIAGVRSGKLVAVEPTDERQHSNIMWRCECDCGNNNFLAAAVEIANGARVCCGCQTNEMRMASCAATQANNQQPFHELAVQLIFRTYVKDAKKRDIEFNLSLAEFVSFLERHCMYCGVEPSNIQKVKRQHDNGELMYSGIDRIDSLRGYVADNCVPCCIVCNRAKRNMSHEAFVRWLKRVALNFDEGKLNGLVGITQH